MSKYTPLQNYLETLPHSSHEVTLSFTHLEKILNDGLPHSASKHRAWWSNEVEGHHVQACSWLDAGWIVESVDLAAGWVRFCRK
jgi:hypothetical protein